MKRFTFTLMVLLILLGGVSIQAETVNLPIKGGKDWSAWPEGYQKGTGWSSGSPAATDQFSGTVKITNGNPKFARLGGKGWSSSYNGQKQTFTMVLNNSIKNPNNNDVSAYTKFVLVAIKGGTYKSSGDTNDLDDSNNNWDYNNQFKDGNGSNETKIVANSGVLTPTFVNNEATIQLEVNEDYDAVYFYTPDGNGGDKAINIVSFTLTIGGGGTTVAAPTISPASGTYDGDLSVIITPGDGNDKVTYSVTGSNEDASHTNIDITAETTINLTGSSTITVTATGYNGVNASSPVTNTYTYGVPSGKTSASITYYALSALLMGDGTSRAFYDFEDGVTMPGADNSSNPLRVSKDFTGGTSNLSIVDCDADHISATGSTKCLKIDFSGKGETQDYYASQIDLYFNEALTKDHTYYVHFWTKAETHVNDKGNTKVEFQHNGAEDKNWERSHINSEVDYDTSWHEYMYEIQPSRGDATMMCFDLGTVRNNVLYIDDIAVFDATSGTTPVSFSDLKSTAVISSSAFSDYAAGDYIHLNVTGSPSEIGYKSHATNDEYKVPYLAEYTDLEQTNGNWLIPVTSDIKSNGLSIKGYNMTLNSVDIYKKEALSEATNNTISSKENHVVVELTRSFVKDTWNTVCLPFVPTSAQADELFGEGYQLAEFTDVSGTTMKFTTITIGDFKAGKPYLVLPKTGCATGTTVLSDVNITAKNPTPVPIDNYTFRGTFTTKTFTSSDYATSRFVATGNELVTPNEDTTLKSLRCYFTVPVAAARSLTFDIDEEGGTTSINTVNGSGVMVNGYYNLNGQRVAKPTKGLFIVNGKKVLVNDKR